MKKKNILRNLKKLAEKISEKIFRRKMEWHIWKRMQITEEGERKKRKQQEGKRTVDEKKKNKKKKKKEKKEKPGSEAAGLLCVYNLKEVFLESLRLLIACKAYALISTLPSLFALFARVFSAFSVHKLYDRYLSNNLSLLLSLILLPEASVSERHILNILR